MPSSESGSVGSSSDEDSGEIGSEEMEEMEDALTAAGMREALAQAGFEDDSDDLASLIDDTEQHEDELPHYWSNRAHHCEGAGRFTKYYLAPFHSAGPAEEHGPLAHRKAEHFDEALDEMNLKAPDAGSCEHAELFEAVRQRDHEQVKKLLGDMHSAVPAGVRVPEKGDADYGTLAADKRLALPHTIRDARGCTLLMHAVLFEDPHVMDELLHIDSVYKPAYDSAQTDKQKADRAASRAKWGQLCAVDDRGRTAWHYAASNGSLLALDLLQRAVRRGIILPGKFVDQRTAHLPELDSVRPSPESVCQNLVGVAADTCMPTALCYAACSGHSSVVTKLLELDSTTADHHTEASDAAAAAQLPDTPLVCAATYGDTSTLKVLLDHCDGAGQQVLQQMGRNGETALLRAAMRGNHGAFNMLLECCATKYAPLPGAAVPGWPDEDWQVLQELWRSVGLMHAVSAGEQRAVQQLLAQGAKVEPTQQRINNTALHVAAEAGRHDVFCDVLAACSGDPAQLPRLLARFCESQRGPQTPLHAACRGFAHSSTTERQVQARAELVKTVQRLLKEHAEHKVPCDVPLPDGGARPLQLAVSGGPDILKLLHAGGATDVNATDSRGHTALMSAVRARAVASVRWLLERGADVNAATLHSQTTALHMAVFEDGHAGDEVLEITKLLLAHDAHVHAIDAEEKTATTWAAECGRTITLRELLRHGGDLDWATDSGYEGFAALFRTAPGPEGSRHHTAPLSLRDAQLSSDNAQLAADLARDRTGVARMVFVGSLLERAIGQGFAKMAAALLAEHASAVDAEGNTLLMYGTKNGWDYVVKHLCYAEGQDVAQRNAHGRAAIDVALQEGEWESFLDLYGAGAAVPDHPNAELMVAASLHQWSKVEAVLKRLDGERRAADAASAAAMFDTTPRPDVPSTSSRVSTGGQRDSVVRQAPDTATADEAAPPAKRACVATPAASQPAAQLVPAAAPSPVRSASAAQPGIAATPVPLRSASGLAPLVAPSTPAEAAGGARAQSNPGTGPPQSTLEDAWRIPSSQAHFSASGGAPQQGYHVAWLISQLMHSDPSTTSKCMGQPNRDIRDRLLVLLRPMMNFKEKVTYFQEEQDRLAEAALDDLGDDDTLHLDVRRGDAVLGDAVEQLAGAGEEALARDLTVAFAGEDGEDGGGLLKEFCQELAAVITKPSSALFAEVPEGSGCYQPSENAAVQADSVDVSAVFWSLGVVVAKAVAARATFPVRFTQSFLKQMLDEQLDLSDLWHVDASLHSGLMAYLRQPLAELGMDDMTFTTERHYFGRTEVTELKPGGADIAVTDDNKEEYVNLLAHFKMTESVRPYIDAFCDGLWACIPRDSLRIFDTKQLGLLIAGRDDIDWRELQGSVKYDGFQADSTTIKWFWEVARELPAADAGKLLAFVTGSSRVPATGFKDMRTPLTITRAGEMRLPSSHTCANQLVLAEYADKEALRQHIEDVLKQPAGFQFR